MNLKDLKNELETLKSEDNVDHRFHKTEKGSYAEDRISIGITTKDQIRISKKYWTLNLNELEELLNSKISDYKSIALRTLVEKYKRTNLKKEIYELYIRNTKQINGWDLVDISAWKIVGNWLIDKDKSRLYKLAVSSDLWERRIAIVSTYAFIREGRIEDTLKIAAILLNDKHDLIHKAVGWMLREVGKKNQEMLDEFLMKHVKQMPRTMLRYAIEKFEETKRQHYLKK
ncbi:DNA alkylation repair protein [Candidatus Woesearchaeota archaeon]|jgi:3-methyladenine DNA glycosylase AlkD|nr:DNA alkylation repair protein [Candidatus Woesearchaeota archaeon]MBT4368521.1 DNA alkylation repair protein [Candidatus Woesearchaeota archaeon]MBT4713010.1 DNA alkylation repair protein [Candidatus Woesearchaeota archaeon]MBT6639922.1 DNA alkylation repair protein [Candidatus Woesearchaeota archaeon]MBT7134094.1 DNA alkylation repair protein [Candidatus Woesearchaeota archaeon]